MAKIIVVSGTPGVGKTEVARALARRMGHAKVITLSEEVLRRGLYTHFDETRKTFIIDEEGVTSYLRELAERSNGILVLDSHYGELAPREYIDKVVVLRLHPKELKRRLMTRGWPPSKVRENVEAELLGVCTVNAVQAYGEEVVVEIDVTGKTVEEVVEEIFKALRCSGAECTKYRVNWLNESIIVDLL